MKKLTTISIVILVLILHACSTDQSSKTTTDPVASDPKPSLELVWETDTTMSTCESALYDAKANIIYVANINNGPWEKDGNGFISILDTDGKVLEYKWVEGLSAPKGMGIVGNKLYVNDIDQLVEIDIKEQRIIKRYTVEGDPALNDVTIGSDGSVYASGSTSNAIYVLKNDQLEVLSEQDFGRLNGLLHQPEGLYYASSTSSQFGLLDMKKNTIKVLTEGVGHGDGIIRLANNDFIVSSWQGEVFYIQASDWSKQQLLDTREQKMNAADIEYIPNKNLLLVPTFFANKVMAYKVVQ